MEAAEQGAALEMPRHRLGLRQVLKERLLLNRNPNFHGLFLELSQVPHRVAESSCTKWEERIITERSKGNN